MLSGTVNAGLGFNVATVPFCTFDLFLVFLPCRCVVEIVRLRESWDSIFCLIACEEGEVRSSTSNETLRAVVVRRWRRELLPLDNAEGSGGKPTPIPPLPAGGTGLDIVKMWVC